VGHGARRGEHGAQFIPPRHPGFTEIHSNQSGRTTPAGTITEFPLPTANSRPWDIAAAVDGSLWFIEEDCNRIGRMVA
jgi:virginiamycin B lyase